MESYRKSLPPLDTLVFFEAAMRHLNFTEAADELFVTQAAVSKRIRQLESWLGVDLFERTGRKLVPTEAGAYLAEKTGMTLDYLDWALRTVKVPARPVVRIASVTALATFWLQPKLREFALSDDACPFNLVTADELGDLLRPEHDLVVLHGEDRLPGWNAELLFPEDIVPVGTPRVVKSAEKASPDGAPLLLNFARMAPNWTDWPVWIQRTGWAEFDQWPVLECASYNQTIGRALKGEGLALGALPLLQDEISSGSLVAMTKRMHSTGKGYFIAWPQARPLSDEARRLKNALLSDP
ncbi:LysR family transcriptional regulator [Roseibium sp. HPY-6]|uniref:LysR family transcriptional regulator n=1 Tax=Roseibium sp. HPY-6 TaxID=3229852 RepID=UPI00338EF4D0